MLSNLKFNFSPPNKRIFFSYFYPQSIRVKATSPLSRARKVKAEEEGKEEDEAAMFTAVRQPSVFEKKKNHHFRVTLCLDKGMTQSKGRTADKDGGTSN